MKQKVLIVSHRASETLYETLLNITRPDSSPSPGTRPRGRIARLLAVNAREAISAIEFGVGPALEEKGNKLRLYVFATPYAARCVSKSLKTLWETNQEKKSVGH